MLFTISLAIVDTRSSSFDAPQQGEVTGRQCVVWAALLSAAAQRTLYFTHFKLDYLPNVIGLVQRIVRSVMRTELKGSYELVQYEYAYRYTPRN